jgi:peptidoglycan/xylan/chitin deacetylase (PgdA/CDA1 family)
MKIIKKIFSVIIVAGVVTASFYLFYMRPRHVTPILMYHAVNREAGSTMNVTPENFSKQMRFLNESGYKVISLDELVEGIKHGRRFAARTVVLTFDDGFEDNYLNAYPVLAKYKIPATIFIITGYIDVKDGYLNWDQIRLMMDNGIDFGGHTENNVYLPSIKDTGRLWEEVVRPKETIMLETGKDPRFFCYPTGGFDEKIKNAVKKAGYKGACTTNRGNDKLNRDVYELNRIKVTNSDMNKPLHFRAKLSGYYNLFRKLKKPN